MEHFEGLDRSEDGFITSREPVALSTKFKSPLQVKHPIQVIINKASIATDR